MAGRVGVAPQQRRDRGAELLAGVPGLDDPATLPSQGISTAPPVFSTTTVRGFAAAPFAAGVRESIARYAQPATAAAVDVCTAGLGTRAELMGAVALALDAAARPGPGPAT